LLNGGRGVAAVSETVIFALVAEKQRPISDIGIMKCPPGPWSRYAISAEQLFTVSPLIIRDKPAIFPGTPETGIVEGYGVVVAVPPEFPVVLKLILALVGEAYAGVIVMLHPPSTAPESPPTLS
jgi:hypothetical protein